MAYVVLPPLQPGKLAKIITTELPSASDWEGAIVYDDTTNTMKISNGSSWIEVGSILANLLVGSDANFTDYPDATVVVSNGNTGHTYSGVLGLTAEAAGDGVSTATGVGGNASTNSHHNGRGVVGVGKVTNTADTGTSIGVFGRSIDTHAGGVNCGVYAQAANGATNYSVYGIGTMHNEGPITHTGQWEDLRFPAQSINPAGAVSPPSVDQSVHYGTLLFESGATDLIAGVAQMPHSWDRGTEVHPHIHWAKTTSASGGVVWQFSYAVVDIGETIPAYSAWQTGTAAVSDSNTADKHALTSFPAITMTGKKESTMILWRIQRKHDDPADDYGADARLLEFDIHYQVSKQGTVTEIPV